MCWPTVGGEMSVYGVLMGGGMCVYDGYCWASVYDLAYIATHLLFFFNVTAHLTECRI